MSDIKDYLSYDPDTGKLYWAKLHFGDYARLNIFNPALLTVQEEV